MCTTAKLDRVNQLTVDDVRMAEAKYDSYLESSIFNITMSYPFWGHMLQNIDIFPSYSLPTLGVTYDKHGSKYVMYINPVYFSIMLSQKQRVSVLLHELHHLIHGHLKRFNFKSMSSSDVTLYGIAADLAVNQLIKDLPDGCDFCKDQPIDFVCPNDKCPGHVLTLNMFKHNGKPFPKDQTAEYYYSLLKQSDILNMIGGSGDNNDSQNNQNQQKDRDSESQRSQNQQQANSGSGSGGQGSAQNKSEEEKINSVQKRKKNKLSPIDQHDLSEVAKEMGKESDNNDPNMDDALSDLIKRTMIKANMGYNNLPQAARDIFDKIQAQKSQINFKKILLDAIKRSVSGIDDTHDWSRLSRRYDVFAPGIKDGELPKLHIYVDTSGSISTQELSEFLDIIDEFIKIGHRKCTISFFHTSLYNTLTYTRGKRFDSKDLQIGGTELAPVMQDIIKKQPDLSIILTDGLYPYVDRSELNIRHGQKIPEILFIISRNSNVEPKDNPLGAYGKTIKVPKTKNK